MKHADIFDGEEYDARKPMGYVVAENFKAPDDDASEECYGKVKVVRKYIVLTDLTYLCV